MVLDKTQELEFFNNQSKYGFGLPQGVFEQTQLQIVGSSLPSITNFFAYSK